jgi:transcriptional regulator with XRE-family HTH domain
VDIRAKQKLAILVHDACTRHGQRGYAKRLGVSQSAVLGWLEARSTPTIDNLKRIALDAGYTLEQFEAYLNEQPLPRPSTKDQLVVQMRQLARQELAEVLEAGVRLLAEAS